LEQLCWSAIAEVCGRHLPASRSFTALNLFWHKWSDYAAICANMHARGVRGHIRLMSNTTALEEYLPDVLARWLATNPGIDIALEERLSHEIAPGVAQAHADIGVLADLAGAEGLETYPFRIDSLVVVVPRGHLLAGRRNIAFVDVLDEKFVGLAGCGKSRSVAFRAQFVALCVFVTH
jgi:DNA-binding transcriptional LysR family regulator